MVFSATISNKRLYHSYSISTQCESDGLQKTSCVPMNIDYKRIALALDFNVLHDQHQWN